MKPRLSPIQLLQNTSNRDALLLKIATDLLKIHQDFLAKTKELDDMVNKRVGPKGDKGDSIRGPQGLPGKDGKTISIESVVREVMNLIPIPKDGMDGITPIKGVHYFTEKDIKDITNSIKSELSSTKEEITPESILSLFTNHPKGKQLSDFVDGFEQTIHSRFHQLARGYLHGGGDTLVAGSGITLTSNPSGTKTITSTGGGQLFENPLSGAVDGTNGIYTFTHNPVYVIADNQIYFPGTAGGPTVTGAGPYTVTLQFFPTSYVKNAY